MTDAQRFSDIKATVNEEQLEREVQNLLDAGASS